MMLNCHAENEVERSGYSEVFYVKESNNLKEYWAKMYTTDCQTA